jgi:hypothetical protein
MDGRMILEDASKSWPVRFRNRWVRFEISCAEVAGGWVRFEISRRRRAGKLFSDWSPAHNATSTSSVAAGVKQNGGLGRGSHSFDGTGRDVTSPSHVSGFQLYVDDVTVLVAQILGLVLPQLTKIEMVACLCLNVFGLAVRIGEFKAAIGDEHCDAGRVLMHD